ncbi:MAG: FAD-dependent oxidoreductase [Terriglobus roseus]|nr:FAD-dependent oxidoreductase [Terriglobus roseus]
MISSKTVLVRGAGVAGLCCAVTLAERGFHVVVTEVGSQVGAGASWKAGGMLAPWCEAEACGFELETLAASSPTWWQQHFPATVMRGTLVLAMARDGRELERFARRTRGHELVGSSQLAALEPDLGSRFTRGLYYPHEGHLDPRTALMALADQLETLGGKVLLAQEAPPNYEFSATVDARGMGSVADVSHLRGVRGEMLLLRCSGVTLSRPIRLLHPRHPVYVVPRTNDIYMVGATMIETSHRGAISLRSAVDLMNAIYSLHPNFGDAEILEMSADLRPSLPDNMPDVSRRGRVVSINGMYRHGFLMSPRLATTVADMVDEICHAV